MCLVVDVANELAYDRLLDGEHQEAEDLGLFSADYYNIMDDPNFDDWSPD